MKITCPAQKKIDVREYIVSVDRLSASEVRCRDSLTRIHFLIVDAVSKQSRLVFHLTHDLSWCSQLHGSERTRRIHMFKGGAKHDLRV